VVLLESAADVRPQQLMSLVPSPLLSQAQHQHAGSAPSAAGPVWHEVTATRAVDALTGAVAIVVTQVGGWRRE
jgi:hypothetical protein